MESRRKTCGKGTCLEGKIRRTNTADIGNVVSLIYLSATQRGERGRKGKAYELEKGLEVHINAAQFVCAVGGANYTHINIL